MSFTLHCFIIRFVPTPTMTNLHSAVCNYTGGLAVQAVDNNADK